MENKKKIVSRLREFMDNEARSCSMDYGCVTPLYVYREDKCRSMKLRLHWLMLERQYEVYKSYLAILFLPLLAAMGKESQR